MISRFLWSFCFDLENKGHVSLQLPGFSGAGPRGAERDAIKQQVGNETRRAEQGIMGTRSDKSWDFSRTGLRVFDALILEVSQERVSDASSDVS